MPEEIEPEPGVAQIDQVRAGVRQRDDSGLVLDQRLDPVVDSVEKAADQASVEILFEAQVKQHVKRVAPDVAGDIGNRSVGEPGIRFFYRRRDDYALPVSLEYRARLRVAQIGAKTLAEARIAEHRLELLAVIGLDWVEGGVAVERVGTGQREIERQRLAGDLDV